MLKKINKIIEYGLYLLVFLLPIQTRWIIKAGESEYGTISLYGTDILLVMLVLLFMVVKFQSQITNTTTHCHCERSETERSNPAASRDIHGIASSLHSSRLGGIRSASRNDSKLLFSKIWWLIMVLDLAIFISIFFAEDKMIAVYKYAVFLLGIGLFWLIVSANYNKLKLIYCFLAGIFLQACLGIWQFLTQSSFACKWLGMAEHNAGELGISVVETISSADGIGERWLRAYGGLDHPNVLGGLLAVGILLIIGLAIRHSDFNFRKFEIACPPGLGRWGNWKLGIIQISNFKFLISGIYFLLLTFTTCLFFTFSRGAWLGLIIGVVAMLAITVVKKNLLAQKKLLEIILILSALIFILFFQFQDLVSTRLSNEARLEVKSNSERIESYKDSWEMTKDNWLFGVGVGNYTGYNANLANKCQSANCEYANAKQEWYYQPVHNVFLLVWAEIGIIGLLFFIVLLLCVMCYVLCDKTNAENKNLNIRIPLTAALFVMFLVDHWWWSLHFGVLLFWLVMGLMVSKFKGGDL